MHIRLIPVSLFYAAFLGIISALPTVAAPAILHGNEPGSKVNIRTEPTTEASLAHYGLVGDRVEMLREVKGGDGYTWYYIRFNQSGAEGWVRGDLVRFVPKKLRAGRITEGVYIVGATDMVLEVKGQKYQYRDEQGANPWKPISELTFIQDGVIQGLGYYWCLPNEAQRNSRRAYCSSNGWKFR
ncbi:MAG: SH3 domain-containing protein [Synechococcales bacterium]|nr:SH3 domain-containing protein [Synechococcales bacterium]